MLRRAFRVSTRAPSLSATTRRSSVNAPHARAQRKRRRRGALRCEKALSVRSPAGLEEHCQSGRDDRFASDTCPPSSPPPPRRPSANAPQCAGAARRKFDAFGGCSTDSSAWAETQQPAFSPRAALPTGLDERFASVREPPRHRRQRRAAPRRTRRNARPRRNGRWR